MAGKQHNVKQSSVSRRLFKFQTGEQLGSEGRQHRTETKVKTISPPRTGYNAVDELKASSFVLKHDALSSKDRSTDRPKTSRLGRVWEAYRSRRQKDLHLAQHLSAICATESKSIALRLTIS